MSCFKKLGRMNIILVNPEKVIVEKASHIAYAYTIKSLGSDKDVDYSPFFESLDRKRIDVEYKVQETDKLGKKHYHGILYLKKGYYRKRLITKGFSLKLEEVYDKTGWIKYISKDLNLTK